MTMDSFQMEVEASNNLEKVIEVQYEFLKLKANLHWLADGIEILNFSTSM